MPPSTGPSRTARWLVLVPLVAAVVVLARLLRNPLGLDDYIHLYTLVNFGVVDLLLTPHAGHFLYLTNLAYVPLYRLFGVGPTAYAVVSLATHLVNVVLCYRLALRLTARPLAAAIATTMWGCAAVHEATVGAFAVYGQILLTTILLTLLHGIVDGRRGAAEALLLVAAAGSFGYGLVLAALWPAVRFYVTDESATARGILLRLALAAATVGIVYAGLIVLHPIISNRVPYGAGAAVARLGRASPGDALTVLRTTLDRMGYGLTGTFFAPLVSLVARPYVQPQILGTWFGTFDPWRVFVAFRVANLIWIVTCLWWARRCSPFFRRLALGTAAIAFTCYAMIAATRDIGWTFYFFYLPMMLAGRYHYFPTVAMTVATVAVLPSLAGRSRRTRRTLVTIAVVWTTVLVALDFVTVRAAGRPWNAQQISEQVVTDTVRRFPRGSVVYLDNRHLALISGGRDSATLPGTAAMASLRFPDGIIDGRRVRFVEHDAPLLAAMRRRPDAPIAGLVVAPEEVPPDAQYVRSPPPPARSGR